MDSESIQLDRIGHKIKQAQIASVLPILPAILALVTLWTAERHSSHLKSQLQGRQDFARSLNGWVRQEYFTQQHLAIQYAPSLKKWRTASSLASILSSSSDMQGWMKNSGLNEWVSDARTADAFLESYEGRITQLLSDSQRDFLDITLDDAINVAQIKNANNLLDAAGSDTRNRVNQMPKIISVGVQAFNYGKKTHTKNLDLNLDSELRQVKAMNLRDFHSIDNLQSGKPSHSVQHGRYERLGFLASSHEYSDELDRTVKDFIAKTDRLQSDMENASNKTISIAPVGIEANSDNLGYILVCFGLFAVGATLLLSWDIRRIRDTLPLQRYQGVIDAMLEDFPYRRLAVTANTALQISALIVPICTIAALRQGSTSRWQAGLVFIVSWGLVFVPKILASRRPQVASVNTQTRAASDAYSFRYCVQTLDHNRKQRHRALRR